jgi:hypothetical protein
MEVVHLTKNLPHDQRRKLFEYIVDAPKGSWRHLYAVMTGMGVLEQASHVRQLLSERERARNEAATKIERMVKSVRARAFLKLVLHAIRLSKHLPKEQRKQLADTMSKVSAAEGRHMSEALERMSAAQRAAYVQHLHDGGDDADDADDAEVAPVDKDELKAASQWS